MHVNKHVDYVNKDNMDNEANTTKNFFWNAKTTINFHVEPNVETFSQPHLKPSGELPIETPTEPSTRQIIDIHELDIYLNYILDEEDDSTGELRGEEPQNVVFEVQYEKNVEADKDDGIPIAKTINENVTKS